MEREELHGISAERINFIPCSRLYLPISNIAEKRVAVMGKSPLYVDHRYH